MATIPAPSIQSARQNSARVTSSPWSASAARRSCAAMASAWWISRPASLSALAAVSVSNLAMVMTAVRAHEPFHCIPGLAAYAMRNARSCRLRTKIVTILGIFPTSRPTNATDSMARARSARLAKMKYRGRMCAFQRETSFALPLPSGENRSYPITGAANDGIRGLRYTGRSRGIAGRRH